MCESFREIGTFQSLTSSTFQVATTNNSGCVYNREGDKVSAGSERMGQISERPPCFRSYFWPPYAFEKIDHDGEFVVASVIKSNDRDDF